MTCPLGGGGNLNVRVIGSYLYDMIVELRPRQSSR